MEYDIEIDSFGNKCYFKKWTDVLHREDGPAIESCDGNKWWYINGRLHREDGPAVKYLDGYKEWWINGRLHRIDGPAIEYESGDQSWYFNGLSHRTDGPALDWKDKKVWYINGIRLSQEKEAILNQWWNNKNGI